MIYSTALTIWNPKSFMMQIASISWSRLHPRVHSVHTIEVGGCSIWDGRYVPVSRFHPHPNPPLQIGQSLGPFLMVPLSRISCKSPQIGQPLAVDPSARSSVHKDVRYGVPQRSEALFSMWRLIDANGLFLYSKISLSHGGGNWYREDQSPSAKKVPI